MEGLTMMTFRDIYEFPLRLDRVIDWVYDNKNQFVFQFETDNDYWNSAIVAILNGEYEPTTKRNFVHDRGEITEDGELFIVIRGWGNLTGTGALNLPDDDAANIQDTFANFIVERLNSFKG